MEEFPEDRPHRLTRAVRFLTDQMHHEPPEVSDHFAEDVYGLNQAVYDPDQVLVYEQPPEGIGYLERPSRSYPLPMRRLTESGLAAED